MSELKTMQDWFDKYGESHQNPTNKAFHWICVPIIFVSIIGILSLLRFPLGPLEGGGFAPYLHGGTVLILVGIGFYLRLSLPMTIGMLAVSALSLYVVKVVNQSFGESAWIYYVAAFVLAWVGQFIGHKIEGVKPSFFDDLKFLMVGPAWLLGFIYKKLGINY